MSVVTNDVQGSLKEALYETLTGILSPHRETRQAAEQRIQALEVTEEYGIHLTEFVVDPNSHLPIRQLASVLLKQYVETHWSSLAEKFRSPELNNATKEKIKELLPLGLRESISKVVYSSEIYLDEIIMYLIALELNYMHNITCYYYVYNNIYIYIYSIRRYYWL